jgi:hypothetical protein
MRLETYRLTVLYLLLSFAFQGYGESGAKERRDVMGCEPGWSHFHKACFHVNKSKETFTQADRSCRTVGGSLASIHANKELDFVTNITL